jgi:hypothetical protein
MRQSLIPTIILIAIALIAAAAVIFFLFLRTAPAPVPTIPNLTITADAIVDADTGQPLFADIYVNDVLTLQHVTHFQVTLPLDGSSSIRVTAPGYQSWGFYGRGGGADKLMQGTVQLLPEE